MFRVSVGTELPSGPVSAVGFMLGVVLKWTVGVVFWFVFEVFWSFFFAQSELRRLDYFLDQEMASCVPGKPVCVFLITHMKF